MRCRAVVLRGVLVRRVIATPDVAALEAEPEMNPGVSRRETLLAAIGRLRTVVPGSTEMGA